MENESVDTVVSMNGFHAFPDKQKAFHEIWRVLKPGGNFIMMDLAMNFDTDECLVTAMFDKGNRNDTMEAIDNIIPFLKGDADMIGLVCNTI